MLLPRHPSADRVAVSVVFVLSGQGRLLMLLDSSWFVAYGHFWHFRISSNINSPVAHPAETRENMQVLKCSHTTAYGISVCQRMIIRSYTQIYVRGTLGIRRARSSYAGIRRWTSLYGEAKIIFWTCSKIFSVCERIDYTLLIRSSYARHTLDTLGIRWIR